MEISETSNENIHARTERLLGASTMHKLHEARVLIFGVGGVGSWCAECLVRTGIIHLTLVDADQVCVSNCNRQLMATSHTIGQVKVEALKQRLLDINPQAQITALQKVYQAETADSFQLETYDFIIDAIDSLRDKADLILRATALPKHITFISSMGAALRLNPFSVRQAEFWKVKGDPLARALREKFKKQRQFPARKFQCVYSEEPPMKNQGQDVSATVDKGQSVWSPNKVQINGSLCHITAIFGMSIAGLVISQIEACQ